MAKRSKKQGKSIPHVFVKVLQNGVTVAKAKRPINKSSKLAITPKMHGELSIPLYPIPSDLEFIEIRSGKVFLKIDHHWEGFATSAGELVTIERVGRGVRQHQLFNGDYGSICLGDLRIMVKVTKDQPPKAEALFPSKQYRGKLSQLLFSDPKEPVGLLGGIAIASSLLAAFVMVLYNWNFHRPSEFRELSSEYTLPFIIGDHLRSAPELLQSELDRRDYITSVIDYFHAFASVLTGERKKEHSRVYPSTVELYKELFADQELEILSKKSVQRDADTKNLEEQTKAVLHIPAIEGETYNGSLIRLVDKINIMHLSAATNLSKKREFNTIFEADKPLNLEDYRSGEKTIEEKGLKVYANISISSADPNEVAMYKEASKLGFRADKLRKRIREHSATDGVIDPIMDQPIAIPAGVSFASFLSNPDYYGSDAKLYSLRGSEFGVKKQVQKVRAPLTGKIDPNLVRKVIEQKRFELQLCYELALRRNQSAGGTMEWRWRIEERGTIADVELVNSTIRDQRMINCIRQKIVSWRFPRPRNGSVEIRHPFDFQPARG